MSCLNSALPQINSVAMSFRQGSFRGKGAVYSRRRGRGAAGKIRVFREVPSVIYEESEEDGELDIPKSIAQIDDDRTITPIASRISRKLLS
jgi:hypothetical protein